MRLVLPRRHVWLPAALSFAALQPERAACAAYVDPLFGRLRNNYYLLRPGETLFESADIVDSNPINKQADERGLTAGGRQQVLRAVRALTERGVTSPLVFYDNGARASQTADILARELGIPRARMEPEFRWLEARGFGELEGSVLQTASGRMRAMDRIDIDNRADESDDGTPSDSVNDVFSRLRNTVAKIETSYLGDDVIIVGGDGTVLSIFAAAACGVNLREHSRFVLRAGEFWDLRELAKEVQAGRFEEATEIPLPSDESIASGRAAIRDLGPRMFSETAAGDWVLGPNVRR